MDTHARMRAHADRRITAVVCSCYRAPFVRNGKGGKEKREKQNGDRNGLIRDGWIVSKLRGFDVQVYRSISRAENIYPDSSSTKRQ